MTIRIIITALLVLHGIIHGVGFYMNTKTSMTPILKTEGFFWLAVSSLIIYCGYLYYAKKEVFWMFALPVAALSQLLIIRMWDIAKYGTVGNILLVILAILSFSAFLYKNKYKKDVFKNITAITPKTKETLTDHDINHLPIEVQKYIKFSGAIGKAKVDYFKTKMQGRIRKTKEASWMPFRTEQYNFMEIILNISSAI
jgi:hypothetical protein